MFVFLFLLKLLYLPFNHGERLPLLSDSDVYHTLFGNIGSMQDLFLKETDEAEHPTRRDAANDDEDPDKLDLELPDMFEFHKDNITNHTFDVIDFLNINEQYANFTKEYKKGKFERTKNPIKNEPKNKTRRHYLDDPDDYYHGESIEEYKKNQLIMVLAQFALHCRYEVGKALLQRDLVRHDKRYKLGYLFNRMRRLKTEQLKQAGASWRMSWDWPNADMRTIMRSYQRVVHYDVDMRDTANLIKTIFNKDESYDYFVMKRKTDNRAGADTFARLKDMLPFVENLNRSRTARNGTKFYEPISALDIAFDEFPKLSDVLPNLVQKTSLDYDNTPGVMVSNISVDIEKINMNKLRRKMDVIAGRFGKDEPIANASRRQAYINWGLGASYYWQGAYHMMRRKTLDLMLQVLYMARHKIRKLENAKHFSTKDAGFRVAYIYRTLTRIYRKMMRLYSYQARYRNYDTPNVQIILHGRVARLHVDFCYLYWVLINVDGAYRKAKGIRKEKKKILEMLKEQMQMQKDAQSAVKGGQPVSPPPGMLRL